MTNFKLNFYRFADKIRMADVEVGVGIDDTDLHSKAQKVVSTMNDTSEAILKVVDANDKLAQSSSSAKAGLRATNEAGVRRLNAGISGLKSLMDSPFASEKFKIQASTKMAQLKNMGMDNYRIKDAVDFTPSQANKVLSQGNTVSNMVMKEYIAQQKQQNDAVQQGTTYLENQAKAVLTNNTVFGKLSTTLKTTASSTNMLTSGFGKMLDKLKHYAVSWRIVYGFFQSIWNTLSQTFEKAAAYQEALNLYRVAMGDYAEEADVWAKRISDALYLDPKQIMQYTGAFYNLVKGLGVGADAAYTMSTNLTQLVYDMSSYLNIDIESAQAKIQSAIVGQSRAVASAGIAMQQASLQELAYSLGIDKTVSSMTQAEKTYLRYIQIMRSTTNMQTDLARTIITPENAIRVIKQQFELLGRAIGNVFIPIVMKAIPYVMALTQILTALATRLASFFGFEFAKIDYSYLNLGDVDTAVEDSMNNISGSAAKTANSVKDSVNRTLAAFDELNVVESKSAGGGGSPGGGVGGGPGSSVLDDLEKYITGYDMLQGLTDELSKKTEAARENLKKLGGILKGVALVIGTIKALQFADTLVRWAQEAQKNYNEGKGLLGLLKNLKAGHNDLITTLGKVALTTLTTTGAFYSGLNVLNDWDGSLGSLIGRLTLTTLEISALTAVAFTFGGTIGGIITLIGGLVGAFAGVSIGIEQYQRKLTEVERYEHLFDGVGVSVDMVAKSFDESANKIITYTDTLDNLSGQVNHTTDSFDKCYDALRTLHETIVAGDFDDSGTIIAQLQESTDSFKNSIEASKEAHINYHNTVLENLKKEGIITESTYKQMKAEGEQYYNWLALSQSQYADELRVLDARLASGKISQQEYNVELQKLNDKYLGIIEPIDDAAGSLANMYYIAGSKINLENPEELNDLIGRLKNSYDTATTSLEAQRETAKSAYYEEKQSIESLIAPLQQRIDKHQELEGQDKETYEKQIARLQSLEKEYKDTMTSIDKQSEELGATYKNYLGTIYGQISEAGKLADDDMKNTVSTIRTELDNLVKFDAKKSVVDLFGGLTNQFVSEGKTFERGTITQFEKWGFTFSEAMRSSLLNGGEKAMEDFNKEFNNYAKRGQPDVYASFSELGKVGGDGLSDGAINSIKENSSNIYQVQWDTGKYSMTGFVDGAYSEDATARQAMRDLMNNQTEEAYSVLEIHSPSRVFYRIGQSVIQGLNNGISDGKSTINSTIDEMSNNIKNRFSLGNIPVNFNVNANKSFNSLLQGLSNFSTKWGNGINDIIRNTGSVFSSLKLGGIGNLIYSAFKKINIKFFEGGGYPTSGDLFFANENGRAEYITSLGNKTAVANQDQMVAALTNAILQGMTAVETSKQPNHIVVQIGNDKVYEGQGKYQNRQSDRYGTTYVKI